MSLRALAATTCSALDPGQQFPQQLANFFSPIFDPAFSAFESSVLAVAPGYVAQLRQMGKTSFDPRMQQLPLADPMVIVFWLVFYFVMTATLLLVGKVVTHPGPNLKLRWFTLAHSTFLCILSLYMGMSLFSCAYAMGYGLGNNPPPSPSTPLGGSLLRACWIYVVSKIPEFVDTFLHAIRGNTRGLSFLHVYHHSSILVFVYVWCFPNPGGDCYLSAGMNSFPIHFVMYGYMALTAFAGPGSALRKFLDKIKYSITVMQIIQFCINMSVSIYVVFVLDEKDRKFSKPAHQLMIGYMLSMIVLFSNFLIVNAMSSKKKGDKKPAGAASMEAVTAEKKRK